MLTYSFAPVFWLIRLVLIRWKILNVHDMIVSEVNITNETAY